MHREANLLESSLHEVTEVEGDTQLLGGIFHGGPSTLDASPIKLWLLRRQKPCFGCDTALAALAASVGALLLCHSLSVALLNRSSMCISGQDSVFIQECYDTRTRLRPRVAIECDCVVSTRPLIKTDMPLWVVFGHVVCWRLCVWSRCYMPLREVAWQMEVQASSA